MSESHDRDRMAELDEKREGTESVVPSSRTTSVLALLLYAGFVVYQSLAGGGQWECGGAVLAVRARLSRSDLLANAVAYAPLGFLWMLAITGPAVARGRSLARRAAASVLLPSALSVSLELLQSCQTARVSSASDWAANTAGAVGGVALALLLRTSGMRLRARANRRDGVSTGWLRPLTAAVAVGWIVSQTMPWVFAADVGTLRANLSFIRHWADGPPLDPWHIGRHAAAWIVVGCACRLLARDRRFAVAGLAFAGGASLCLQLVLDARAPLSFEELIGMAAGAVCVLPFMLHADQHPQPGRWAVALFCGALVTVGAYELRPDPSALAATRSFSWWPRVGLGGLLGALDYALLFGWFGFAAVVAARWAGVAGYQRARRWWPLLAILATLAFEIAQTGIPGRGPDLSAPVFTLLAVLAANACVDGVIVLEGEPPASQPADHRTSRGT